MPTNPDLNNLALTRFRLKLDAIPEIEYRVQSVELPGFTLGTVDVPSPLVRIPFSGNISYDELTLTFLVGENLKDYLSITNWMKSLGYPEGLAQYNYTHHDGSVLILDSNMRPILDVKFSSIFPVNISSLSFDSTLSDVQYATATVSFRYTSMEYKPITS